LRLFWEIEGEAQALDGILVVVGVEGFD